MLTADLSVWTELDGIGVDKDGNYVGAVKDKDLFSTKYPWFCDSVLTPQGSIFTVITDERQDKSADEVVVFQLNGF